MRTRLQGPAGYAARERHEDDRLRRFMFWESRRRKNQHFNEPLTTTQRPKSAQSNRRQVFRVSLKRSVTPPEVLRERIQKQKQAKPRNTLKEIIAVVEKGKILNIESISTEPEPEPQPEPEEETIEQQVTKLHHRLHLFEGALGRSIETASTTREALDSAILQAEDIVSVPLQNLSISVSAVKSVLNTHKGNHLVVPAQNMHH